MPDKDGDLDVSSVPKERIIRVEDSSAHLAEEQSFTTISHIYSRQDLFAHRPCIEDVRQTTIASCFLLAPLHAIISTNPNLIYGMMRDRRGGWVVVRLFDESGQPIYYEVEKTFVTTGGGMFSTAQSLEGHAAWWPYMLEKAYAFHRLRGGRHIVRTFAWEEDGSGGLRQKVTGRRPARTYVDALSFGAADEAMQTLLGGPTAKLRLEMEGQRTGAMVNLSGVVCWQGLASRIPEAFDDVFGRVYADRAAREFASFYDFEKIRVLAHLGGREKVIRQETMFAYFAQHYPNLTRATLFLLGDYICKHFPGKRGTGLYTVEQERLFDKIVQMLAAQCFVVIGTGTNLGSSRGTIASTSEHKVKGLAGPHSYQVVGTATMQGSNVRFLRIRNPWLNYVRGYSWKTKIVQGQSVQVLSADQVNGSLTLDHLNLTAPITLGPGEFLLELSDLTKRFARVHFATAQGQTLPSLGELRELI